MDTIFEEAIAVLSSAFEELISVIAMPAPQRHGNGYVWRFANPGPREAIVLKLARLITLLQSGKLLLDAGFLQEVGAIQRSLDEIDADIIFLSGALIFGKHEPAHSEYLKEFFAEEFDQPGDALASSQKRHRVSRAKIRAYNARTFHSDFPVDTTVKVLETIEKTYSGFVHATSVHTMDMYYGNPPYFHLRGMKGTWRQRESQDDFKNYIYRSVSVTCIAARAFDKERLFQELYAFSASVSDELEL